MTYEITYSIYDNSTWSHRNNLKLKIKANSLKEAIEIFNKDRYDEETTRYIDDVVGLDNEEKWSPYTIKNYVCPHCNNEFKYWTTPQICSICGQPITIDKKDNQGNDYE